MLGGELDLKMVRNARHLTDTESDITNTFWEITGAATLLEVASGGLCGLHLACQLPHAAARSLD